MAAESPIGKGGGDDSRGFTDGRAQYFLETPEQRNVRARFLRARMVQMALRPVDRTPNLSRLKLKRPRDANEEAALRSFVHALEAKKMLPLPPSLVIAGDTDAVSAPALTACPYRYYIVYYL